MAGSGGGYEGSAMRPWAREARRVAAAGYVVGLLAHGGAFVGVLRPVSEVEASNRVLATPDGLGVMTERDRRIGVPGKLGDETDLDAVGLQCRDEAMPRRMRGHIWKLERFEGHETGRRKPLHGPCSRARCETLRPRA